MAMHLKTCKNLHIFATTVRPDNFTTANVDLLPVIFYCPADTRLAKLTCY